ncbi:MAG: hypothetical protein H5T95_14815 [Firmicutes bacterium]|nr:hypothetical protein [Bacillota bacterium]
MIVHEGSLPIGWVILCQGLAKLAVSTEDGKRLLLRFCGPGELLAGPPPVGEGRFPWGRRAAGRGCSP